MGIPVLFLILKEILLALIVEYGVSSGLVRYGLYYVEIYSFYGLPWWLSGKKNPPANAGDVGLIPGSGRSPGEGNGNPLQYSCLENPMDGGAWQATVHKVSKESITT